MGMETLMLNITVAIQPNGIVSVPHFQIPGLDLDNPSASNGTGDAASGSAEAEKVAKLKETWTKRIIKAVETFGESSRDTGGLGGVVEWVLDRVERDRLEEGCK